MQENIFDPPLVLEHAGATSPEFELASQVLQGVSAIFLLLTASRSPQMDELQLAVGRVRAWMSELDDSVRSTQEPFRGEMLPVTLALGRAVGEVGLLAFPAMGYDPQKRGEATARSISHSASLLQRMRDARDVQTRFTSACCAADVQHISESRNH